MVTDVPRTPGRGRRWAPQYWVQGKEVSPGNWVLDRPPGSSLKEEYEYRFVFDRDRGLWRVDARVFVQGG